MGSCILIVGPLHSTCGALATALGHDGFEVDLVADENDAVKRCPSYDVVLAHITTGVVPRLKAHAPAAEIVLLTPASELDEALEAVDQGAFDFVLEPYFPDDVSLTVACAAARRRGTALGSALSFVRKNAELAR